MNQVARKTEAAAPATEVVEFQKPRLPFDPVINERFGVDKSGWKALVEAIYPAAKTVDSIVMALAYCKARNLDVFKRPVHIVPMWDSKKGGYVETVWPGIAELRTTAFRTGNYAGCDEAEFGPAIKRTFTGRVKTWKDKKEVWEDRTVEVEFPEWCRITVYRELSGRVCKFVGPKVKWLESYATIRATDIPNDMWQSRPEGQIEKCAEAAALRKAFPEELGNDLTADEMAGRRLSVDDGKPTGVPPVPPAPPAPSTVATTAVEKIEDAEFTPAIPDLAKWLDDLDGSLATVTTVDDLNALWVQDAEAAINDDALDADGKAKADAIYQKHLQRLQPTPKAEPSKPAGLSDADRATLIKALEIALKKAGNDLAKLDEWRQANHAGLDQLLDAERDALIAKWEAAHPAEREPAAPAKSAPASSPDDDFFPPFDPSAYEA